MHDTNAPSFFAPTNSPHPRRQALTIAATLSYRSPFLAPIAMRDEANACKMQFALAQSDHLTTLRAYNEVDKMGTSRFDFCRQNYISIKTLQTIAGLKRQLLEHLSAAGFVRQGLRSRSVEMLGKRLDGTDGCAVALEHGLQGGYDLMRDRFPRSDGRNRSREDRLSSLGNERAQEDSGSAAAIPSHPSSSLQDRLDNTKAVVQETARDTVAAIERKVRGRRNYTASRREAHNTQSTTFPPPLSLDLGPHP
jgi:hypothetical protein